MATEYVLYNNRAGSGRVMEGLEAGVPLSFIDITKVTSYPVFFGGWSRRMW